MTISGLAPASLGAGVGLRLPHLQEVAAQRPAVSWFEVHAENFLANPHAAALLMSIAGDYPLSIHTVGVSVGSAGGVDRPHLARVAGLVAALDPVLVSGHLAWSTHAGEYLNDLLPLPYDEASLDLVCRHVDAVQSVIGRPFLLENPSSYVGFAGSSMREPEFLNAVAARTGCLLLCDVSNIHVSAINLGYDAEAYLCELDSSAVAEFHLGGFTVEADDATPGETFLIDTHGCAVAADAWHLFDVAVREIGPRPTLVEWDNDIPALAVLQAEATRAGVALGRAHAAR